MDVLRIDIAVPLRSFDLELALEVSPGVIALVGPSGAGKTTVLRAIAGLTRPDRGSIELGGETWFSSERRVDLPPDRRSVGLVFQDYALFPHMSVRRNVVYGGTRDADSLLRRFRIDHLHAAKPDSLSGGERQRVALARALARDPRVLLLDEPLSALDAHTKDQVRAELREHLRELALPTLLVTHDFDDAAVLADTVGVIVEGRLVQLDTPHRLVSAPADAFVAGLTGANLLYGIASPAGDLTAIRLDDGETIYSSASAEGEVGVAVHPWEVTVSERIPADSMLNHVSGRVTSVVEVGNRVRVEIGPLTAEITRESATRLGVVEGAELVASFKATATRLVPLTGT